MNRPPTCPALVIDLDGVLRRFDPTVTAAIEARAALPGGVLHSFAHDPQLLRPALTGAVTDQEWRYRVAQELAGLFGDAAAADAVTEWAAERGAIDAAVLDLVRRVRRTVPVVLLATATTRLEADLEAAGLDGEFAAVVSSARTGAVPPDAAAFEAAEQAVAALSGAGSAHPGRLARPGRISYIDDEAANVAAARARGWRAWRFTDAPRMEALLTRWRLVGAVT